VVERFNLFNLTVSSAMGSHMPSTSRFNCSNVNSSSRAVGAGTRIRPVVAVVAVKQSSATRTTDWDPATPPCTRKEGATSHCEKEIERIIFYVTSVNYGIVYS
jgi:hypothetical protein